MHRRSSLGVSIKPFEFNRRSGSVSEKNGGNVTLWRRLNSGWILVLLKALLTNIAMLMKLKHGIPFALQSVVCRSSNCRGLSLEILDLRITWMHIISFSSISPLRSLITTNLPQSPGDLRLCTGHQSFPGEDDVSSFISREYGDAEFVVSKFSPGSWLKPHIRRNEVLMKNH